VEVALCGHATLASAFVVFNYLEEQHNDSITFDSLSGPLIVTRNGDLLTLDFPVDQVVELPSDPKLDQQLGLKAAVYYKGKTDLMVVLSTENEIFSYVPKLAEIAALPYRGIMITSPGSSVDFVSRFFGPASGINEDPVTGSAHTTLTPYWAQILGKKRLTAQQLSARKGTLTCELAGERVLISGQCVLYLNGKIFVS
jgi:PhzF family phenazine biosynthesis protein